MSHQEVDRGHGGRGPIQSNTGPKLPGYSSLRHTCFWKLILPLLKGVSAMTGGLSCDQQDKFHLQQDQTVASPLHSTSPPRARWKFTGRSWSGWVPTVLSLPPVGGARARGPIPSPLHPSMARCSSNVRGNRGFSLQPVCTHPLGCLLHSTRPYGSDAPQVHHSASTPPASLGVP